MSTHDPSKDEYLELETRLGRAEQALGRRSRRSGQRIRRRRQGRPGHAKALADRLAMTAAAKRAEEREQAEAAISDIRPSREERKIRLTAGADRRRGSGSAA